MVGITKLTCLLLIAFVLAAAVAPRSEAALTCGSVYSYLNPCIPYVANNGPLGGCCPGIKSLYGAARTTPDRKTVCSCLKSIAAQYASGPIISKAAGLPAKCGVSIPYKISPSTDCARVT